VNIELLPFLLFFAQLRKQPLPAIPRNRIPIGNPEGSEFFSNWGMRYKNVTTCGSEFISYQ